MNKMIFAANLRKVRNKKGMTQAETAKGAGLNIRQYQFYESGERLPNVLIAKNIADCLECSLDCLVTSD